VAYATAQFELNATVGEGKAATTQLAALQSLADQGDPDAISELAALPQLPHHGAHLWTWFTEISATRSSSGMGPNRLTRAEIHAWEADEHQRLELWERRAIMKLDAAWLANLTKPK
jgi:hypothetical protein